MTPLNGVLPIDKPVGPTSHDLVAEARRALKLRRIGHTGTLDPFASGLLLLCLGPATRVAEYLSDLPKRYEAVLRLGLTTDTDDRMGDAVSERPWDGVTRDALEVALRAQLGEIDQIPPLYSAKRVAGERMYAAARRGETPERKAHRVTIHAIELTSFDPPHAAFVVECSSGTYIRAIARDVGESLGVGAHLRDLRRTRIGTFDAEDALLPEALVDRTRVERALISPERAVGHLPAVVLDERDGEAIRHGRQVAALEASGVSGPLALFSSSGTLLGMGERVGDRIRPRKVFQ